MNVIRISLSSLALFLGSLLTVRAAFADLPQFDRFNRTAVLDFYDSYYCPSDQVRSGWVGNVASGNPGTVSSEFEAATLERINFFRAFAGAPSSIFFREDWNQKCRAAALMMSANSMLNHYPTTDWLHYSTDGALAASKSNLTLGNGSIGPKAINQLIQDEGASNGPIGHRRWLLYPPATEMGIGMVDSGGGNLASTANWVIQQNPNNLVDRSNGIAWPPAGYVPYSLIFRRWSFSLPGADFNAAGIIVSKNGSSRVVTKEPIAGGFGDNTIVWTFSDPDQGKAGADITYDIEINNVVIPNGGSRNFTYRVIQTDPSIGASKGVLSTTPGAYDAFTNAQLLNATYSTLGGCINRGGVYLSLLFSSRSTGQFSELTRGTVNPFSWTITAPGFYKVQLLDGSIESEVFEFVSGQGLRSAVIGDDDDGSIDNGGNNGNKNQKKKKKKKKKNKKKKGKRK